MSKAWRVPSNSKFPLKWERLSKMPRKPPRKGRENAIGRKTY